MASRATQDIDVVIDLHADQRLGMSDLLVRLLS